MISTRRAFTRAAVHINNSTPQPIVDSTSNHWDHRVIGHRQQLFMLHPSSPGSVFILPHGQRIVNKLRGMLQQEYYNRGYQEVSTPLLYHPELWERSGHWQNYRGDMFQVHGDSHVDIQNDDNNNSNSNYDVNDKSTASFGKQFGLKPMNCPAHCLIYQNSTRSYRDLPLRLADFSALHRNELSGTLTGLTRLRQFHQDDAHIFCRPDQVLQEIRGTLEMIHRLYHQVFRFPSYRLALSTRPTHGYIGTNEQWEHAERILHTAIREHLQQHNGDGRDSFDVKQGDGAFYGPKIDLQLTDSQQRTHQLATIQLDFQLPERFQLTYSSADGTLDRPVLVHRAALGSLERFWAIWMEECKGRWPFWCSPRQFMLIPHPSIAGNPLGDEFISRLAERLGRRNGGVRYWVDVDRSDATLAKKVFHADQLAYNYILVIGKREIETGKLSVRSRRGETVVGGDDNKSAVISIDDLCAEADRLSESHL